MVSYPTWDWSKIRPQNYNADCVGSAFEGGRSITGVTHSLDYSGGGITVITYDRCQLFNPESHRYWNELQARLNGGVLPINIPILVTWLNPFPGTLPAEEIAIDTSPARIQAQISVGDAVNSNQISITLIQGEALQAGHKFSINHPNKGWHLYTIKSIDSTTDYPTTDDTGVRYNMRISPPLREETLEATICEFDWPRCAMRLAPGESMDWALEGYWRSQPSVSFVEYFPPT